MGMRKRPAGPTSGEPPRRSVVIRLVVLVVGSALGAVVAGFGAAWSIYEMGSARSSGGQWEDLGNAIAGCLAGLAAFVWLYVAAIAIGVRWAVRRGRRFVTALAIIACTAGTPALIAWNIDVSRNARMPVLGFLGATWAMALACALIGFAAGVLRGRLMAPVGCLAVASILVSVIAGSYGGEQVAEAEQITRYEQTRVPLALIDGRDLTSATAGMAYLSADKGYGYDQVTVTFRERSSKGSTSETIDLIMERDPKPLPCERGTSKVSRCTELGARRDGSIIWGDPSGGSGQSRYQTAWVDVPGGRWKLTGRSYPQPIDRETAVALLSSLEPVDAAAFTDATRKAHS